MAKLAQQEKDSDVELKHIESIERQANQDRETKYASEIKLGKLGVDCVIRSILISKDQLLEKESDVTLINETTQTYPLALVDIDCPFFS